MDLLDLVAGLCYLLLVLAAVSLLGAVLFVVLVVPVVVNLFVLAAVDLSFAVFVLAVVDLLAVLLVLPGPLELQRIVLRRRLLQEWEDQMLLWLCPRPYILHTGCKILSFFSSVLYTHGETY